jgi:hypothetical protein
LFWQSGPAGGRAPTAEAELSDAEFAQMLASSPHAVPEAPVQAVDGSRVPVQFEAGASQIDFQAQYDVAGIPNTDEVEQLEGFLSRLDTSLPQTSRLAAAQAFLGAVGKDKEDVLSDAARKIACVRGILLGKEEETQALWAEEQRQVEALQAQIEQHRQRMEAVTRELEAIRLACVGEESRLQAARVFFGSVEPSPR